MNFGESLGYWYFRLNGFIPLLNFVLHEPNPSRKYNADSDLLAIRYPHVFETVGGQSNDWDNDRFSRWDLKHDSQPVCAICEIKTGRFTAASINRAFGKHRLRCGLRRLGVMPKKECEEICRDLQDSPVVHSNNFTFAKVLICCSDKQSGGDNRMTPCCKMELSDTVHFIKKRMDCYSRQKGTARMFFPGDLIQFFAWSAGVQVIEPKANERE